nr:5'-3' exonuclease-like [Lytechinus pictus]
MSQAPSRKFLLVDGNSILYRAFYGSFSLVRAGEKNTNAVYTSIRMLRRIIEKNGPFRGVLFFFDAGKETFRHQENSDYKGKRKKTPKELVSQLPIFKRFLQLLGIAFYEDARFEADDLLGSAATRLADSDYDVELLSGDRDLLQLVSPKVSLFLFKSGVNQMKRVADENFERLFGFEPEAFLAFKTLVGDSSDNLPGVPGIGPKRALDLVKSFPTIEALYSNLGSLDKRSAEILESSREQAFRMLR